MNIVFPLIRSTFFNNQIIKCYQVTEEWLRFDDEDFKTPSNSELGAVHPGMEFWNEATGASGSEVYYCYYTPQTK